MGRGFNPRGRGRGRGGFRGRGGGKRRRSERDDGGAEQDGKRQFHAGKRGRGGYHFKEREEPAAAVDPLRSIFAEHDDDGAASRNGQHGIRTTQRPLGKGKGSAAGASGAGGASAYALLMASLSSRGGMGAAARGSKRPRPSSSSSEEEDDEDEDDEEEGEEDEEEGEEDEEEEEDGSEESSMEEDSGSEDDEQDDEQEEEEDCRDSTSAPARLPMPMPVPVPAPSTLLKQREGQGQGPAAAAVVVVEPPVQPDTFAALFVADPLAGLDDKQALMEGSKAAAPLPLPLTQQWLQTSRAAQPLTLPQEQERTGVQKQKKEQEGEDREGEPLSLPSALLGCPAEGSLPPLGVESLSLLLSGTGTGTGRRGDDDAGGGPVASAGNKALQQGQGVQRPSWDSAPLLSACSHLLLGLGQGQGRVAEGEKVLALACDPTGAHPRAALLRRAHAHAGVGGGGCLPLPPPMGGLDSHWHVRPKIAQAWARAYGGEVQDLLQGAYAQAYRSSGLQGESGAELVTALARALERPAAAGAGGGGGSAYPYPFTPLQSVLWPALHAHADVYFPARTQSNAREIRALTCLHVANHVSRARQAVEAHTTWLKEQALKARQAKLARASSSSSSAAADADGSDSSSEEEEKKGAAGGAAGESSSSNRGYDEASLRDQGFTRPRALILLPTRHACLQYVRTLLRILAPEREAGGAAPGGAAGSGSGAGTGGAGAGAGAGGGWVSVSNRNRFFREFMEEEDEDDEEEGSAAPAAAAAASGHNSGGRSKRDEAEDEADTAAEKDLRAGKTGAPAVLRLLAKRRKQMMSDDEAEDRPALVPAGEAAAGPGAGAGGVLSAYPYALGRQGWPQGLLARSRREKMEAEGILPPADAEDDNEEEGVEDTGRGPRGDTARPSLSSSRPLPLPVPGYTPKGPKKGKNEPRRKDKAETIGDNIQALEDAQKRAERDARRAAKAAERAARLAAAASSASAGTGGGGSTMPADYTAAFRGNIDDDFRIGLSVGRKTVSLYSDFYRSDILLCSPLGLRRIIGGEGDRQKDRDSDFLSSLEIVVLDAAEHMLMQNWQHVRDIFARVNVTPSKPRPETDFSRVRESVLAGNGRLTRQTLLFASHAEPDFSALLRRACSNVIGSCTFVPRYGGSGQLARVHVPVRQVFQRVQGVTSLATADDARFAYFKDRLLPDLLSESASSAAGPGGATVLSGATHTGVCIYVPSYYDYVRLRNCLDAHSAEFVTLTEYTEEKDIKRARSRFAAGDSPILLLTERFMFFRRLRIRGIRHLLFYGPPAVGAHYYPELLHQLQEASLGGGSGSVSCTVLFTRYDGSALERLVGSETAGRMLQQGGGDGDGDGASKNTFVFV